MRFCTAPQREKQGCRDSRPEPREHLDVAMEGGKGPRESDEKVWKVRGKSGASRVRQVRQEGRFTMKATVTGEVKKEMKGKRPLQLKSRK